MWSDGQTTQTGIITEITKGLHSRTTAEYKYNLGIPGFSLGTSSQTMYLNCFLNAQQKQGDCRDFGNYLCLLVSAVGIDLNARRCNPSQGFWTNTYYPAGYSDDTVSEFAFHQYGLFTNVYDAAIRFSVGGDPPTNMVEDDGNDGSGTDYENALIDIYNGGGWHTEAPQEPAINTDWYPTLSAIRAEDITSSSADIMWNTNVAGTSKLHWDTTSHAAGDPDDYANHSAEYGIFRSVTSHEIEMLGLDSDTPHYYRVESSGKWSAEEQFATLP